MRTPDTHRTFFAGGYYLNLLWNYLQTPGLYRPEALLAEPLVFDAASALVDMWTREQRHNESSQYRFSELPNGGLGAPVGYTGEDLCSWQYIALFNMPIQLHLKTKCMTHRAGMIWSAFRPSDDPTTYGYSIPSNMYVAGALQRALELNRLVWGDAGFGARAGKLLAEVEQGAEWGCG